MAIEAHKAQIGNTQRRRFARSPQSALCPVCTADFLPGFNDPLLTGVNVKGATFNRNAQIDSQQVGKGGTFFNGQSQIGTQKDIGLGGLGFINKGSQVQLQFGRGKREAQFHNIGSSIGTIVGLEGSTFLNQNSQIDQAHASAGASVTGVGSQYRHQQGYTNDQQLLTLLGRRKKREAQFTNIGSGVGTQIGLEGSTFLNQDSQIDQAHASAGASITGVGSQYRHQQGYTNDVQLLTLLGRRKKREAQFHNFGSGVGTQVGFDGSTFNNQNSQIDTTLASAGASVFNKDSQSRLQQGVANNAQLLALLRSKRDAQFHNEGSSVGEQVGFDGSTFVNLNSQIAKAQASAGANIFGSGSQYQVQAGYANNAELLAALGRNKREAQFVNVNSGIGEQVGFDGSTFSNQHSQIGSQLGSKGAVIANQFSQTNLQKGFGSNAELLSGLNFPTAVGSGHIFNKQSQIGTQFGGRK